MGGGTMKSTCEAKNSIKLLSQRARCRMCRYKWIDQNRKHRTENRNRSTNCSLDSLLLYMRLCTRCYDTMYIWRTLSVLYGMFSPGDVFNKWRAAKRFYFTRSYRLAISEQRVTLMAFNFGISHNSFPCISISRVVCWQWEGKGIPEVRITVLWHAERHHRWYRDRVRNKVHDPISFPERPYETNTRAIKIFPNFSVVLFWQTSRGAARWHTITYHFFFVNDAQWVSNIKSKNIWLGSE